MAQRTMFALGQIILKIVIQQNNMSRVQLCQIFYATCEQIWNEALIL